MNFFRKETNFGRKIMDTSRKFYGGRKYPPKSTDP
jgi:hypothetical protein